MADTLEQCGVQNEKIHEAIACLRYGTLRLNLKNPTGPYQGKFVLAVKYQGPWKPCQHFRVKQERQAKAARLSLKAPRTFAFNELLLQYILPQAGLFAILLQVIAYT